MSLSRQDRLQALGLWPVWRLRVPTEAAPEPEVQTAVESAAPAVLPIRVLKTALKTTPEPVPEPAPAAVMQATAPLEQVAEHNAIAEMDWPTLNAATQSCKRCELAKSRIQAVPGVGDMHAEWLFIGEAPGANEDRQGEPFVGDAGKLLDAILAAIGLERGNNVFIANVLKSRPPANRDPKPEEVAACLPYLERQIDLIQPRLIVALGRFAAQSLLATDTPIGKLRGQVHRYRGVPLVVTYHPAYLLRNPLDKAKVWEDLVLARNTMHALKNPAAV
jgi:DNA polymerase